MFDGAFNVQLGGKRLKVNNPKLTVVCFVEHTVSLFFNDVSKIPIVTQIIGDHKMIYNIFGCGIYHKPHSIFKSKSQEFHNKSIDLFSGNKTRMAGYFMGIHRDLWMQKMLQDNIISSELISITTNTKFTKAVNYIHDNKSLKIIFLILELFYWQILILQEWTKFITIWEWPSSSLRKQNQILIIREIFLTYDHKQIYETCLMTKVMKKSQYQNIVHCILKYLFCNI